MPRQFWLPSGQATALAEQALRSRGWSSTSGADWNLAWTLDPPSASAFDSAQSGRWVNHLRGIGALVVKSHLCITLREAATRAAAVGTGKVFRFAPETFLLPAESDAWMRVRAWEPDAVWIQKPADQSRGRGVALVTDPAEVRGQDLVVQRYVDRPHLLDGYKYSLRFYVAIVSLDPLIAYLFDGGFTKFASRPFSLAGADRADRFRHLTNPDILRDDPDAAGVSLRNLTHLAYRDRLHASGVDVDRLWRNIRGVLTATLGAALPQMRAVEHDAGGRARGQFELLGVDIALDAQLQPWLLECNLSPSLSVEASDASDASREEADIKTRVIGDLLQLVGADTMEHPLDVPGSIEQARERIRWHDQRRGRFDRLWPSPDALAVIGGMTLSAFDTAVLDDEARPALVVNGIDAIPVDQGLVLYDARRDRVTLLDRDETHDWPQRARIEWIQDGWLASPDTIDRVTVNRPAIEARPRHRWNRDRAYAVRGLRVLIQPGSDQIEAAIDTVLGWHAADDLDEVDLTMAVPRMRDIPLVLGMIDQHALEKRGQVLRRRLPMSLDDEGHVLLFTQDENHAGAVHRHVTFGGAPFVLVEDGKAEHAWPVRAVVASAPKIGDALLDLIADGPGVIRVPGAQTVRLLADWLSTVAITTGSALETR